MRRLRIGFLVVLVGLSGCRRIGRSMGGEVDAAASLSPKAFASTPTLQWDGSKLNVAGTQAHGYLLVNREPNKPPLKLDASFADFPPGTKVKVGTEEGTTSESGYVSFLVDVKPAVVSSTLDDLKGPVDLNMDVRIEAPVEGKGTATATTKLPKEDLREALRAVFLRARDGGFSFGNDDQAAAKIRGAAVVSGYSDLDFVGAAKTVKDLDWVVIAEDQTTPRTTKKCSFKEGPATLKVFDANVSIVERRTGKQLRAQVLKASEECPMFALVDKDDNSTKNKVRKEEVIAFARGQLSK